MWHLARLRLRYRLLAIALLTLLPVAAALVNATFEARRTARDRAATDAVQVARAIAASQERAIQSAQSLLAILALIPDIQALDGAACNGFLANVRKAHPRYAAIGVVTPTGEQVCASPLSASPGSAAERSWFRRAIASREFVVGDYQIGKVSGKPSVGIAQQMLAPDGTIQGVLYVALDLVWLSNQVVAASLPPNGTFVLLDAKGTVLARYPDPAAWIGKDVAGSELYRQATAQPHDAAPASPDMRELAGLDGVSRLYHTFRVGSEWRSSNMYGAVGISLDAAHGEFNRVLTVNLAALGGLGIVLLGLGYWASERLITGPFRQLVDFSRRIAAGNLSARSGVDHEAGELGALAASLDGMAGALARNQARLAEQNRLLAESQETAHIGSWEWTIDDPTIKCSAELARMFRLDPGAEEMPLHMLVDLVHPDDRESCFDWTRRVAEGLPRAEFEFRLLMPDGEVRHCWSVVRPGEAADPDGKPVVRGTTQDITERRRAEIERERGSNFVNTMLDTISDGIIACDTAGRIVVYNKALEAMHGPSPAGLPPDRLTEYFGIYQADGKTPAPMESLPLFRALRGERIRNEEITVNSAGGKRLTVLVTGQDIVDSRGERTGAVISVRDITERRQTEAHLQQAQKMEAVGQLTGGIAHDFNNLLSIVIGNLDSLIECLATPAERELATEALDGALRGAELTKQMLAFARRQNLDPTRIDIGDLLRTSSAMLKRTLGEQVVVHTSVAEGLWPCLADRSQLETTLLNLAINARDAMPEGGALTIEAANAHLDQHYAETNPEVDPGDYVKISISDTGTGIPADVLARVTEPFFTTKAPGKGTGLGLSMVHGFAKQSGGHLKIYSEPGHGTTVNLYLPRASGVEQAAGAGDPGTARETQGHETILVVEDNDGVRRAAVRQLTELGYTVIEAADAGGALAALANGAKVDLLFSDVVMPGGMTGFGLAKEVRRLHPEMKIILVTGFAEAALRQRDGMGESVQLLGKPYRRRELAERIRQVLDGDGVRGR